MDIGSLLVILALAIVVACYIARPLLEKRGFDVTENSMRISELQAERDRILMILQELDMDHAMRKVSEEDYRSQRSVLVNGGVRILKELDRLASVPEGGASEMLEIGGLKQSELEALIEHEIQRRREISKSEKASYCPQCGRALQEGDRFCAGCGAEVDVLEAGV
jgi:hypothetical protein